MNQLDLIEWERPKTEDTDPRTWETRTFRQDGARIEVKLTEETNYRGWYDYEFMCYYSDGRRALYEGGQVKAGWEEVEAIVEYKMRALTRGKIPRGAAIHLVAEARGGSL